MRRGAIVGLGALVAAAAVAGMLGRSTTSRTCAVCGSVLDSTEVGFFWGRTSVLTWTFEGAVGNTPAYLDTFAAWGHTHTWWTEQSRPEILFPSLVFRTTACPRPFGAFRDHWLALEFCARPEFRREIVALARTGEWTTAEVEDALRFCESPDSCAIDAGRVDAATADRRERAHTKLQASLDRFERTPR